MKKIMMVALVVMLVAALFIGCTNRDNSPKPTTTTTVPSATVMPTVTIKPTTAPSVPVSPTHTPVAPTPSVSATATK